MKPLNMLLREDGHLFLADFGIANVLSDTNTSSITQAVGTLAYMAPEQFDGKVSRASDIYALGCVLFQMLTSTPPFTGTQQQMLRGHLLDPVPSLRERGRVEVSAAVQEVIGRALAKQPQDRSQAAGELAAAFEAAIGGPEAGPTHVPTALVAPPQPGAAVIAAQPPQTGRISRRTLIVGGPRLAFPPPPVSPSAASSRSAEEPKRHNPVRYSIKQIGQVGQRDGPAPMIGQRRMDYSLTMVPEAARSSHQTISLAILLITRSKPRYK